MAKRQRLVEYNCASTEYVSFGRRPKRSIKFLDDKQAKLFYSIVMNCEDIRIRTAFNIFIFTGLRRGEVAGLEWGDIDFENKRMKTALLTFAERATIQAQKVYTQKNLKPKALYARLFHICYTTTFGIQRMV